MRARFEWEARSLRDGYAAALWAMERHLRSTNREVAAKVRALRQEIGREFGWLSRLATAAVGPLLLWSTRREERRLAAGQTYEPESIIERRNWPFGRPVERLSGAELVTLTAEGSSGQD